MKPSLSVIIPSQNRHNVLKKSLSCLNLGCVCPDEVLLIDDASSPALSDTIDCNDFKFPLRIIRKDKQVGAAKARNTGIEMAKSDILLFLDDDIWADPRLVYFHKFLHKKHHRDEYAVAGRVIFDPELIRTPLIHFLEEYGAYRWLAKLGDGELYSTGIVSANISIKRRFLNGEGFDENFPFNRNEDTEFGLRLMERGFEPRYHYAPSAIHHSFLTMEKYISILTQGGFSKAYWTIKRPDDTLHCMYLEGLIEKTMKEKIFYYVWREFLRLLPKNFWDSDISTHPEFLFKKFKDMFSIFQRWIQEMAVISGWIKTVESFEIALDFIIQGKQSNDPKEAHRCFRKAYLANTRFYPLSTFWANKLMAMKQYDMAMKVLEPFNKRIWTHVKLGEICFKQGKYKQSLKLFIQLYKMTKNLKFISIQQRKMVNNWIENIAMKHEVNVKYFIRLFENLSENDLRYNEEWITRVGKMVGIEPPFVDKKFFYYDDICKFEKKTKKLLM
jgi:glycosyltransferase involved in cell wall biosynthesis